VLLVAVILAGAMFLAPLPWVVVAPVAGFLPGALTAWRTGANKEEAGRAQLAMAGGVLAGAAVMWMRGHPAWLLHGGIAAAAVVAMVMAGRRGVGWLRLVVPVALVVVSVGAGLRGFPVPMADVRRVVVFGDSLTAGVPMDNVGRYWPAILGELIGGEVVALAHPGDTAADSLARWEDTIRRRAWKSSDPAWQPDAAIILLGGNDILRRGDPEKLRADLERWLVQLSGAGIDRVLLIEVPSGLVGGRFTEAWRGAAGGRAGVVVMPAARVRSLFTSGGKTLPDNIHLNQAGHEALATMVARFMARGW
jgi:lysophospholipase L1-like esterase